MEHSYHSDSANNVRDILTTIFKHQKKIIITLIVVFCVVAIAAFTMPKVFEGRSVLLIKFGREYLPGPEESRVGGSVSASVPTQIINGEVSILTSRDLLMRVVKAIGPFNLYPELSNIKEKGGDPSVIATELFAKNLMVRNLSNSNLIEVSFIHQNPFMAAKAVDVLVEAFKDKHLEVFATNSTAFLEQQRKVFQEKLRVTEGTLSDFKQKNRVFSFEEQRTALIQQRSGIDTNLKVAQNQIHELEQKAAFIKSPKWMVDVPAELRTQLAAIEQREREYSGKYTESSRTLQNIRQETQVAKESIKRNADEQRRTELGKVEGDLNVARARADSLRSQLAQVDGEIQNLSARSRELQDLQREATQQEQSYQTYAKKLEESLIMDDMDRRKMIAVSVVERSTIPVMAKKQKLTRSQMLAAGLFGGIAAGLALAFFLEFTSSVMTTPYSAEKRLSLPVMVAVTRKL